MNELQWLECKDPRTMLQSLQGSVSERKLRLFACACCRRIWDLLPDGWVRRAVEVGERYADGEVSEVERQATFRAASTPGLPFNAAITVRKTVDLRSVQTLSVLATERVKTHAYYAAVCRGERENASILGDLEAAVERTRQASMLRCIFGVPGQAVLLDPAWLSWNGATVRKMAQTMYDEQTFNLLPILADALADADCTEARILGHLRGPGPHVHGCWVLDLLSCKQ